MQLEWYGQSAFRLADGDTTVFIDPFDDLSGLGDRGMRWEYPAIEGVSADLLLVTHEHRDHNGVGAIGGDPVVLRSTAGTHESPIGEVVGIASEHDDVAGTSAGRTRCGCSCSAGCAWRTSATSDRRPCATRNSRRSGRSTS